MPEKHYEPVKNYWCDVLVEISEVSYTYIFLLIVDTVLYIQAVSYKDFFSRIIWVGRVKTFPRKKSSGAQSEDLGPSLIFTIQELKKICIPGFICSVFHSA